MPLVDECAEVLHISLTRIVGFESHNEIAVRPHHERISAHWLCREDRLVETAVKAAIWLCPPDCLEFVSVQMEWMLAGIVIVEDDLDDVSLIQDERVGVVAVHLRISCLGTSIHDAVQRGHNRWSI